MGRIGYPGLILLRSFKMVIGDLQTQCHSPHRLWQPCLVHQIPPPIICGHRCCDTPHSLSKRAKKPKILNLASICVGEQTHKNMPPPSGAPASAPGAGGIAGMPAMPQLSPHQQVCRISLHTHTHTRMCIVRVLLLFLTCMQL